MTCDIDYDELAAFALGNLPEGRTDEVRDHAAGCRLCMDRLAALRHLDGGLQTLGRFEPPAGAVLRACRAAAAAVGPRSLPEVMTPEEVAQFLRVGQGDVGDVLAEVPAFEIAGKVRVRRERLLAWIAGKELDFGRQSLASEVAGILTGIE